MGVDTSDSDFNAASKTGGSKTHTLTTTELPKSMGTLSPLAWDGSNPTGVFIKGDHTINLRQSSTGDTKFGQQKLTLSGGGNAFSVVQPYFTCYIWQRTV